MDGESATTACVSNCKAKVCSGEHAAKDEVVCRPTAPVGLPLAKQRTSFFEMKRMLDMPQVPLRARVTSCSQTLQQGRRKFTQR